MAFRNIAKEFQEFINRGNVMDLAVGVIIGGGFTAVMANSLVGDVIQPLISFVTGGGTEVPGLALDLNGNVVNFSAFISAIINFLITAAAVFAIVKALNKLNGSRRPQRPRRDSPRARQRMPRPNRASAPSAANRSTRRPRAAPIARASSPATATMRKGRWM